MEFFKRILRAVFMGVFLVIIPSCLSSEVSHAPYDINAAVGVQNLLPVVVIGSGPAGLSAALYTCRANIKTIVIEGPEPGGQLMKTTHVENWPGIKRMLGQKAVAIVREQALTFGAEFLSDTVERIDTSTWPFTIHLRGGKKLRAMTVIVATGADPRYLGVPGEQEYWGGGVSACAICDAALYKGLEAVVVGGGDSAIEEATQLAAYAKKVTILVRKDYLRAASTMQDHLKGYPNISVMFNVEVQEILGNNGLVSGVRLLNNKTNKITDYPTDGVFLAIGRVPNSRFVKGVVDMDKEGHIQVVGRSQATSVPGIFAAGDVVDAVYRQAGVASGDGIKAGLDAGRFLTNMGLTTQMAQKLEPTFFTGGEVDGEGDMLDSISSLEEFEQLVVKSDTPVVLDFFTEHCPSCLQMMPKLARISQEFVDKAKVYKVDAEKAEDLVEKFNILRVPCIIIFKNGQEIERYVGEDNMEELKNPEGIRKFFERIIK